MASLIYNAVEIELKLRKYFVAYVTLLLMVKSLDPSYRRILCTRRKQMDLTRLNMTRYK